MTKLMPDEDVVLKGSKSSSGEGTHAGSPGSLSNEKRARAPVPASSSDLSFPEVSTEPWEDLQITDDLLPKTFSHREEPDIALSHGKDSPKEQNWTKNIDISRYLKEESGQGMVNNEGETTSDGERRQVVLVKSEESKQDEPQPETKEEQTKKQDKKESLPEQGEERLDEQQDFKEADAQVTGRNDASTAVKKSSVVTPPAKPGTKSSLRTGLTVARPGPAISRVGITGRSNLVGLFLVALLFASCEGAPTTEGPGSSPKPTPPVQGSISLVGVREGETYKFTCSVPNDLNVDLYWFVNKTKYDSVRSNLDSIVLNATEPLDVQCQAYLYEKGYTWNIYTTTGTTALTSINWTPPLEVNEGDRVTLLCMVDSKPAAGFSWLVDGKEVCNMTANRDHYVVERATCSDNNKTYMCCTTNPHLPGLKLCTLFKILVNCTSDAPTTQGPGSSLKPTHADEEALTTEGPGSSPKPTPPGAGDKDTKSSKAWIAALVIGLAAVIGLGVFCLCKKCRSSRRYEVNVKAGFLLRIKGLLSRKQKGQGEPVELKQFWEIK